jgi:hypothetical protein
MVIELVRKNKQYKPTKFTITIIIIIIRKSLDTAVLQLYILFKYKVIVLFFYNDLEHPRFGKNENQ